MRIHRGAENVGHPDANLPHPLRSRLPRCNTWILRDESEKRTHPRSSQQSGERQACQQTAHPLFPVCHTFRHREVLGSQRSGHNQLADTRQRWRIPRNAVTGFEERKQNRGFAFHSVTAGQLNPVVSPFFAKDFATTRRRRWTRAGGKRSPRVEQREGGKRRSRARRDRVRMRREKVCEANTRNEGEEKGRTAPSLRPSTLRLLALLGWLGTWMGEVITDKVDGQC